MGKKQTIKHFDKAIGEYLINPLFSQFCPWFLDESNRLHSFPERSAASDLLSRCTAQSIDDVTVNFYQLVYTFPVLGLSLNDHNDLAVGMLGKVLKRCCRIKDLVISAMHPARHILTSLSCDVFESLKSITIGERKEPTAQVEIKRNKLIPHESPLLFLHSWTDNDLEVFVHRYFNLWNEDYFGVLESVLKICATRKSSIFVRFRQPITSMVRSIIKAHPWIKWKIQLYYNPLIDIYQLVHECLPSLHTLVLVDSRILESLETIAQASVEGKLPNLCVLGISGVRVDGRLHMLLLGTFPSLTTLVLTDCGLIAQDLTSLAQASVQGKLPELKHLDISFYDLDTQNDPFQLLESISLDGLFREAFPKLTSLIARHCWLNIRDLRCLAEASGAGKLKNLTTLDFTLNPNIAGHLSVLLCQPLSSLNVLILRKCELTSDDMRSLACASAENRLPELRHLDLSQNPIGFRSGSSGLFELLSYKSGSSGLFELLSYKFPSLAYLILCSCGLNYSDLDSLVQAKLAGKLPALRYLDVSFNCLTGHLSHLRRDPRTGHEVYWDKILCEEEEELVR